MTKIGNWIYKHKLEIVGLCIIMLALGSISLISLYDQQIASLKESVCDIEYGYYGFEARCSYWNWEIRDKHHYNSLKECEEAYYRWDHTPNCVVKK